MSGGLGEYIHLVSTSVKPARLFALQYYLSIVFLFSLSHFFQALSLSCSLSDALMKTESYFMVFLEIYIHHNSPNGVVSLDVERTFLTVFSNSSFQSAYCITRVAAENLLAISKQPRGLITYILKSTYAAREYTSWNTCICWYERVNVESGFTRFLGNCRFANG